ncbi:hypothetical protein NFI96_016653 [Prochilodus magdalenae]|nr:hypothetical protein NFI96_016653 [Prochilodus magdalenae]
METESSPSLRLCRGKVVMLEQKIHELESELDKTRRNQLKEQCRERHAKDRENQGPWTKQAETLKESKMVGPNICGRRQALTVVFQQWFHVSAEEDSCAGHALLCILRKCPTKNAHWSLQFLVNMVDDNGTTALHYSILTHNFSIVKLLLDTGDARGAFGAACEVDLRNKIGYTAIMLASLIPVDSPKDVKVIQQLMELGDVNARAGQVGQTALHLAVRHGRVSTVKLLLAQGADINAQDRAGTTALISACDRGHTDIVRILLEDPDCDANLTDKVSPGPDESAQEQRVELHGMGFHGRAAPSKPYITERNAKPPMQWLSEFGVEGLDLNPMEHLHTRPSRPTSVSDLTNVLLEE